MPDSLNGGQRRPVPPETELAQLIEANRAGFTELARQGVQPDPVMLLHTRIDTLAELAFGNGPGMLRFRLQFERKISAALEEIRGEVRKAQLAAGAHIPPEQVRQMAQQQGLLGPNGKPLQR